MRFLATAALGLASVLAPVSAFAVTAAYRSVGDSAALATGSGANTLTITGTTATFQTALPANVGVGDILVYDPNASGNFSAAPAVIVGRTSSTSYTVSNAAHSGAPTATVASSSWKIFRAYANLVDFQNGDENPNILSGPVGAPVTPINFDTRVTGVDITAAGLDLSMNVAIYANGTSGTPGTGTSGEVQAWVTDSTHPLRYFVPHLSTEVGTSQRHEGVWSTSRAFLAAPDWTYGMLITQIGANGYAVVEGMQFSRSSPGVSGFGSTAIALATSTATTLIVRDCIFFDMPFDSGQGAVGLNQGNGHASAKYFAINNFFYNVEIGISQNGAGTFYAYNNTLIGVGANQVGIESSFNELVAKNNISIGHNGTGGDYVGAGLTPFSATSTGNISQDATSPNSGLRNLTPTFINAAGGNYRLATTDTVARGQGVDLSADADMPFSVDIEGLTRTAWDIGAFAGPAASVAITDVTTNDFGTVAIGDDQTLTFTATNSGGMAATSIVATALAAPYSFVGGSYPGTGGTCGASLAVGASCTIKVTFTPTVAAVASSSVVLTYATGGGTTTASRNITGTGAALATLSIAAATSASFGSVVLNSTADRAFIVTNAGTVGATALQMSAGAPLSAPYAFVGGAYPGTGGTCTGTLAASASCTIVIRFTPTAAGVAAASAVLSYHDGSGAQSASIAITGTGVDNVAPEAPSGLEVQ